jgi:hypothetical protein
MRAWVELSVPELLAASPAEVAARLAAVQMGRRLSGEPAQLRAWDMQVVLLQRALTGPGWRDARLGFEYDMLRLEKRVDVVLVTPRAIFVLEFKVGAEAVTAADLAQVEDYAQDLQDFHAASRAHPIIPVLVSTAARSAPLQFGLPVPGVVPVAQANAENLADRLAALHDATPTATPLDAHAWFTAA